MKKLMLTALVGLFAANVALAQAPATADKKAEPAKNDCAAKAAEKKLAGAAKSSFMKKCEKDSGAAAPAKAEEKSPKAAQQEKMKNCNKEAAGKKGDERKAFMKTCLSGGK